MHHVDVSSVFPSLLLHLAALSQRSFSEATWSPAHQLPVAQYTTAAVACLHAQFSPELFCTAPLVDAQLLHKELSVAQVGAAVVVQTSVF
jgi:hypothetical protein